jgi:hypothetical protein
MRTSSTFTVTEYKPTDFVPEIETALATGHAHLVKEFTGGLEGWALAQFSAAYNQGTGVGTYVAMESFEGTVDGLTGTFNFAHSATTDGGPERLEEFFLIVPSSGTGDLKGINGTGSISVDDDGTHRLELDYELD